MKTVSRMAVAALAVVFFSAEATAQVAGLPVDYAPAGSGVTLHGTFGRGLNNNSGKQNSVGGGVTLGLASFQVGVGVSYINIGKLDDDEEISFGAHGAYPLPLAPTAPVDVSIVAGVGILSVDVGTESQTNIFIPAGVSVAIDVPSPSVSVTPWISPQFRYRRAGSVGAIPSSSNSDFGVSGGVNVTLPVGFGFHGSFDYDNASEAFLVGGGVHYTIPVPSLTGGM